MFAIFLPAEHLFLLHQLGRPFPHWFLVPLKLKHLGFCNTQRLESLNILGESEKC
jgi:hypothetical protein